MSNIFIQMIGRLIKWISSEFGQIERKKVNIMISPDRYYNHPFIFNSH